MSTWCIPEPDNESKQPADTQWLEVCDFMWQHMALVRDIRAPNLQCAPYAGVFFARPAQTQSLMAATVTGTSTDLA